MVLELSCWRRQLSYKRPSLRNGPAVVFNDSSSVKYDDGGKLDMILWNFLLPVKLDETSNWWQTVDSFENYLFERKKGAYELLNLIHDIIFAGNQIYQMRALKTHPDINKFSYLRTLSLMGS